MNLKLSGLESQQEQISPISKQDSSILNSISNHQLRHLADCYFYGEGKIQDQTEALRLYLIAAEQGDTIAQSFLTICLDSLNLSTENIHQLNTANWFEYDAQS